MDSACPLMERAPARTQIDYGIRDFTGIYQSALGVGVGKALECFFFGAPGLVDNGRHRVTDNGGIAVARTNSVHGHAVLGQLEGECPGQPQNAVLGGAIGADKGVALERGGAGNVDDAAGATAAHARYDG